MSCEKVGLVLNVVLNMVLAMVLAVVLNMVVIWRLIVIIQIMRLSVPNHIRLRVQIPNCLSIMHQRRIQLRVIAACARRRNIIVISWRTFWLIHRSARRGLEFQLVGPTWWEIPNLVASISLKCVIFVMKLLIFIEILFADEYSRVLEFSGLEISGLKISVLKISGLKISVLRISVLRISILKITPIITTLIVSMTHVLLRVFNYPVLATHRFTPF